MTWRLEFLCGRSESFGQSVNNILPQSDVANFCGGYNDDSTSILCSTAVRLLIKGH